MPRTEKISLFRGQGSSGSHSYYARLASDKMGGGNSVFHGGILRGEDLKGREKVGAGRQKATLPQPRT